MGREERNRKRAGDPTRGLKPRMAQGRRAGTKQGSREGAEPARKGRHRRDGEEPRIAWGGGAATKQGLTQSRQGKAYRPERARSGNRSGGKRDRGWRGWARMKAARRGGEMTVESPSWRSRHQRGRSRNHGFACGDLADSVHGMPRMTGKKGTADYLNRPQRDVKFCEPLIVANFWVGEGESSQDVHIWRENWVERAASRACSVKPPAKE
jgi:hypothetical protein